MSSPSTQNSSRKSKSALFEELRNSGLEDERVLVAMEGLSREIFVPLGFKRRSYENTPLPIGQGQTLSQPYTVALMTSALELVCGEKILEVGTGSGYQTALLARLGARVYTVERIASLAVGARARLEKAGYDNITYRVGDGSTGWPEHAPYDRILVAAAGPDIPACLVEQLAEGGILVMPVGEDYDQTLLACRRRGKKLERKILCGCLFVPLIGEEGWGG
ncbi:MAG: protein-L-isoaspartate(D-aspartate) O-methyltransferase [Planctomycetes bacterium]|nr:protein-L-isoaspartate(D-aspartate) O-methyltransferase [Planctomycetota bacterium]